MLSSSSPVEQLQAAVEAWGIGVYEWEHETGRVSGSRGFFELYGWPGAGPMPASAVWSTVHATDRAETWLAFQQALLPSGDGRVDLIHRVVHPDGKLVWLHLRAQTSFEAVGGERRARATTGSVVEVTEHKHIEQQLRRTEARFEEAVRSAQFGIFEHNHLEDPRAENCYWSPRLREIFGVSATEPGSAATLLSRVPAEDVEMLHAAVACAHDPQGTGYYDVEHRYLHPTLGLRWLLIRSSTYFAEVDGQRIPVRTVGAMLDVTARRKSEQEHEQRALILDAMIDFVAIMQPDGALVYLNRAARQFLGISPCEDVSRLSSRAAQLVESLRKTWQEGMPAAARDGAWQGETELMRHDGSLVLMSQVLLAHRGVDGQPLLFSTVARDISRERQLEENMRQAQKMEAVGRLAGGIAHDFNNILSAILSFAYVAAGDIGESGTGYLELQEIIVAGKRAAALTQQLLAFSRKQVLRPRVVDVGDILTRMAPMLERLVGEHIEFALSLEPCALRVKVDPTHLEQVLLNLAINARDAMENGGRLSIDCQRVQVDPALAASQVDIKPGRYVLISVSDTGSGMDPETRAHVFEPFFTTKDASHGTGLGLATVFGIVKQSGGSVCVDSERGCGSTFRAYIPSSDEPLTERVAEPRRDVSARGGVIMVAEDDAAVRQVVVNVLERAGYTVVHAPGPIEALAVARELRGPLDLLLTDVIMPQLSGKELAERLAVLHPNLSVVYMSGYTDKDIVHRGILDEAVNFLPKPVTPVRLLDIVAQVLGNAQQGQQKGTLPSKAIAHEAEPRPGRRVHDRLDEGA
jgi:two-component system, cell cycle sensor histidine kinase and response regulator CckA